MTEQKILILDIETKPITAYVWKLWDQNVGLNQVIDDGGVLCIGLKWLGQKAVVYSEWEHGREAMLQATHDALTEADAVVTYNGDRFDLTKLNGEFLLAGMPPVPNPTSIDLYKTIRKMGFISSKLAFVGPALKIGAKLKHEGFELWAKVIEGNEAAQKRMAKYCCQDVVLTEKLYLRIKPFIRNHPFLGKTLAEACPSCGSKAVQKRGYRRTRMFRIQRNQCQSCGHWHETTRSKVT